ncbi:uncharacterized protein LOC116307098 [Actinia tenebrosa]|uniref:Uncharacterized protein LOC116307098 n=1 Tax=Actinia tenebrosa TaxID=6105 RepID=A0A6P8J7M0_ACTTE|nr:uncharacterized protein LOC116307098 [Actinia tenebrosa]
MMLARRKLVLIFLVIVTTTVMYLWKMQIDSNTYIIDTLKNEKRDHDSRKGASKSEGTFAQALRNVKRQHVQASVVTKHVDLFKGFRNVSKNIQNNRMSTRKHEDIEEQVNKEWKILAGDISESERSLPKMKTIKVRQVQPSKSRLSVLERLLQKMMSDTRARQLPKRSPCPYMGLGKIYNETALDDKIGKVSCKPRILKAKDCKMANKAYKIHSKRLKCTANKPIKDLCVFQETWRSSPDMIASVRCDLTACGGNPVQVINIDPEYGILADVERWYEFSTSESLEDFIPEFVAKNSFKGLRFCFLRCRHPTRGGYVKQILSFPPIMEKNDDAPLNKNVFNFNILVLDSVSRAHFYRSLPKTVKTMRKIVHDKSKQATVLDFELLQSAAPYTFYNMRSFMSGKSQQNKKQEYGIKLLYGLLKSKGFYTMLQEDSCWYDSWGSLFTNNVHQNSTPKSFEEFAHQWDVFTNRVFGYHIDDFGLSHTSCDVYRQYGTTNPFEQPKICFSGKPYGDFFLDYTAKVFQAYRDSDKKRPVFAYTHLNVGHEFSGRRIRQIDEKLSWFVRSMAKDQDTLTIILSDHGPKTTKFSFKTMSGRAEIYDSLLFMILPKNVAEKLEMQRTRALFVNQRRLMTTLDLHKAIISFVKSSEGHDRGVFTEVSPQRTCANLTMKHSAVCKCTNWETLYPDDYGNFTWLAEFALGEINNNIQKEFMSGGDNVYGFGKCQRLVGNSFKKVRHRMEGDKHVVTMDIIVKPMNEIFEAQFRYSEKSRGIRDLAELSSLRRVSIYRHFKRCVDPQVPLDHCVCNNKTRRKTRGTSWKWIEAKATSDILNIIKRTRSFKSKTSVKNLHGNCLLLLSRRHKRTLVYEIANACSDRKYKVRIAGRSKGAFILTRDLPISISLRPLTIHFLFGIYHFKKPYNFYVKTSYKVFIEK